MAGSIICGFDNSTSSKKAARVARVLAARLRLGLVFVCAADVGETAERLEALRTSATDVDCGATWLVGENDPADCLVDEARARGAALIVVGAPRSTRVTAELSRRAPCPVVVVPNGTDASPNRHAEPEEDVDEDRDFAGGIARLGLGGRTTDFAGGIARFGLGVREPGGL